MSMSKAKRVEFIHKNIRMLKGDKGTLDTDRMEAYQYYRADKKIVDAGEGRSQATTTDLQDTIEWIKPSLLEIFAGGDDIVNLQPVGPEDVEPVKKQNVLVNHQLRVKNAWFDIFYDLLHDALLQKIGVVKYQWHRKHDSVEKEFVGLTDREFAAELQDEQASIVEGTHTSQDVGLDDLTGLPVQEHDVTIRYAVTDEYPLIEAVPPEEFGFPLDVARIKDAYFVYHRTRMKRYDFIRKYGKAALKKALAEPEASTQLDDTGVRYERYADLGGVTFVQDEKTKDVYVYECYYYEPDTGKARVTRIVGDQVLMDEDNPYKRPPFVVFSALRLSHRVCGQSMHDVLRDIQRIRTSLLRQIMDFTYFVNNGMLLVDPTKLVMLDDIKNNNRPGALIRTIGDPGGAVVPLNKGNMSPEVFAFHEFMLKERDYHSGVTRSFQGVNPDILNKTWRGQREQVYQASQRITLMARIIAEDLVKPLVTEIVNMNLMFLDRDVAIRYLGDWVEITPDNIVGRFDVIVNVGLGTTEKATTVQEMQQLLNLYAQMLGSGAQVVTSENVYNAMAELLRAMGYKNVDDFVTNPQLSQAIQALIQAVAPMAQGNPQLAPIIQRVMMLVGGRPEQVTGQTARTGEGQTVAEQPQISAQPMQLPVSASAEMPDYFG